MLFLTRAHVDELRSRGYDEHNIYSEPSPECLRRAEELIVEITEAFHDVQLGVGVGLWEGQAIDDYETDEVRGQQRAKDEKEDWSRISAKHLNACHSSLSFFDPLGMRFHLPAYICCDLRGEFEMGLDFQLSKIDDWAKEKFGLLSPPQRKCVASYLEFLAEDIDSEFSRKDLLKALNHYWRV